MDPEPIVLRSWLDSYSLPQALVAGRSLLQISERGSPKYFRPPARIPGTARPEIPNTQLCLSFPSCVGFGTRSLLFSRSGLVVQRAPVFLVGRGTWSC